MRLQDIDELSWPPGIEEKVYAKHGLSRDEVESSFFHRRSKVRRRSDVRYYLYGRTDSGSYVVVVFEYEGRETIILTARRMTTTERRMYERK